MIQCFLRSLLCPFICKNINNNWQKTKSQAKWQRKCETSHTHSLLFPFRSHSISIPIVSMFFVLCWSAYGHWNWIPIEFELGCLRSMPPIYVSMCPWFSTSFSFFLSFFLSHSACFFSPFSFSSICCLCVPCVQNNRGKTKPNQRKHISTHIKKRNEWKRRKSKGKKNQLKCSCERKHTSTEFR